GGIIIVVASATDISVLPADALPAHAFTTATLLRLAHAAGLRSESCGLVRRGMDTPAADSRLAATHRLPWLARAFRVLLRRPVEVSSGLLELRVRVEENRPRAKLSIVMPVFNEARTFLDTFHRV